MSCCSDPYKTYNFLKEHDEVFQLDSNKLLLDLDFLLRSTQICKKCTILGNLRTITQEVKKETKQMTALFPWAPFWSILVCKISEF